MDETLLSFTETRLRTVFGRLNGKAGGDEEEAGSSGAVDPLYPSLDAEPPEVHRRERSLYRPPWDPRDRWRQLRPTQPLYAPPESDLPVQFRYEDLSGLEKADTVDADQDRLLGWLLERFNRGIEYKYNGQLTRLTADQAVRQQVFTPLQILDEQLGNLGLSSSDQVLQERRRRLLEMQPVAAVAAAASVPPEESSATTSKVTTTTMMTTTTTTSSSGEEEEEEELDGEEFGQYASSQQQVVVTVHEATWKPQRRKLVECGDLASPSTIECDVDFRRQSQHRVAQFGDAPSCESGGGGGGASSEMQQQQQQTQKQKQLRGKKMADEAV